MDQGTLARHIRAHGRDPDRFTRILEVAPGWLADAEALREAKRRSDHLARLPRVLEQVRVAATARTVRWDGTDPLLRGDRLSWHEDGARHDMIVRCVGIASPENPFNTLDLEPPDGAGEGASLGGDRFREIVVEGDCRRHLWPDETCARRKSPASTRRPIRRSASGATAAWWPETASAQSLLLHVSRCCPDRSPRGTSSTLAHRLQPGIHH